MCNDETEGVVKLEKLLKKCIDIFFDMSEKGYPKDLTDGVLRLIIDLRNDLEKRWVTIDGRHVDIGGDGDSGGDGGKPPVDSDGKEYSRPRLWLPPNEYAHVMSTISTHYKSKFKGKSMGMIELEFDDKWANYYFEIHGFNEYNIFDKEET